MQKHQKRRIKKATYQNRQHRQERIFVKTQDFVPNALGLLKKYRIYRHDAADILQDTRTRVAQKYPDRRYGPQLARYFFAALKNSILMYHRERRKKGKIPEPIAPKLLDRLAVERPEKWVVLGGSLPSGKTMHRNARVRVLGGSRRYHERDLQDLAELEEEIVATIKKSKNVKTLMSSFNIFKLYYLEGFSSAQIGKQLGLKPATVDTRLSRFRKFLREKKVGQKNRLA